MLELQVRAGPAEQEDVGLWTVDKIVHPARALLHPKVPPFCFSHEVGLGNKFGYVRR